MRTWAVALVTSGAWTVLCLAVLWFARAWLTKRIVGSIDHHYNVKLENLRSELRGDEEQFKARLRSYESQLESIRSSALIRASSRQDAFDKRRLLAIDQLWDAVGKMVNLRNASRFMQTINFEEAIKKAPHDAAARKFFETLANMVNLDKIERTDAHSARPFVSKSAWAMYSAYAAIGGVAAIQLIALKHGADIKKPIDEAAVKDLISASLPHQLPLVEQFGIGAIHYLMGELEERLLDEIAKMLRADEETEDDVKRAASIIKSAASINEAIAAE
jgi:hypothetical protein